MELFEYQSAIAFEYEKGQAYARGINETLTSVVEQQAEIAGLNAAQGHLSALVDDLRGLLGSALDCMKSLHDSATADESSEDLDACIPADQFRKFVDTYAAMKFHIAKGPHDGLLAGGFAIGRDPCPGCESGGFCSKPSCGRLVLAEASNAKPR